MKYYKNPENNEIYVYGDDDPESIIPRHYQSLSEVDFKRTNMTTIELSENSITVLNKLELDDRHILCINVDTGDMPADKAQKFCLEVAKTFQNKLECEVVVAPKNVEFTVIERT